MAQLNFNAAEIDTTSRDAIPSGTYEAVVTESEMKATKNGLGMGINLTFEILSNGPAKGRKVFVWINYENQRAEAQRIGREELASLCKAVGIANLTDTNQLHNLPLLITVGLDRNDPTRNVVKKYAAKAAQQASPAQKSPQAAGAAPWAR
ncbi:MAG: DUF669 domain-containing protein [Kiritimatiellae bacterium]|nr:DUF669 domain-containing protein [Kiritimatiellia bacterium]